MRMLGMANQQMANGRWQMADSRWQMADGRWQAAREVVAAASNRWVGNDWTFLRVSDPCSPAFGSWP